MKAYQLNIESKHKKKIGFLANINDFRYSDGGMIDPSLIIKNPQISLYCLDDIYKQAVFVELPLCIDLTKVPFVYQAQYEHAQQLYVVPYEMFTKLAYGLPEVKRPIFIYMTGRSGSTLLSHIFNESKVAISLSEPDVATQLVHLRYDKVESNIAEIHSLSQSVIRFLFKPYHTDDIQAHVLKFRSEGLRIMDLLQDVFPCAKNLFLYRNAISWVTSFYQLIKRTYTIPEYSSVNDWKKRYETQLHVDLSYLTAYLHDNCTKVSIPEQLALWGIVIIEWYLEQIKLGTPVLAVRYSDLIEHRVKVVKSIFTYCGLPTSSSNLGLRAFDGDSQAGSKHARKNPKEGNRYKLNIEQTRSVLLIFEQHPILSRSDYTVPGTLQVERS